LSGRQKYKQVLIATKKIFSGTGLLRPTRLWMIPLQKNRDAQGRLCF
jgi:hypothetical protein